ncbi:UDP-N-acetylmuramoyl-tripeptide--D-alanyl-D-alanine ligase [Lebetimonas natsushimae]|uniref:UDP-N-acetylmuramoyl-tripeptide--D-alanyl-D-alanine ligase n=1 Tax=Lebetimonas natsushimae TaxID=1936991 RepID=A0A292YEJ0_9BACT|nr:UDP-N-acetylmuramoyl-tripeptide--D-alanyl-D-alanine ligase [Lebetimonas natsushimae]GAX88257.1 UDP-N-acetylmuramoyl-tripeptide--D-alanyl-D-alanine ligase [Lebetimonas natsushimae]
MFQLIVNFITAYILGYYLITVLQWYNYKVKRIIFHFHKPLWHLIYFVVPVVTYIVAYKFFWIYLFFGLIPALALWSKRTKGLDITKRVKRFFLILGFLETLNLLFIYKLKINPGIGVLTVLILSMIIAEIIEYTLFIGYKKKAKERLNKINPTIIAITASYGKTSIKNFLYQLLNEDFKTYKTPRSVNTLKGIVLDINTKLPEDTQIYITEAGARERGDIREIVKFLENEYSILGKIGPQHIEYFKSLENIKKTKYEIFESPKLKKGFSYEKIDNDKVVAIKDKIKNVKSSLDGIEWDVEIDGEIHHFKAPILGEFNVINVTLAVFNALEFIKGIEKLKLKVLKLESVPHRLQKIEAGGKIIIDDSFNGNIEGMLKSFELVNDYKGRKIIVTPGILEGTKEMNEKLAKKINQVFDIAIITGETNRKILCSNITIEKIVLKNKKNLEKVLSEITKPSDLILFSNDFPEYL